jgi:hypothetical protein
MCVDEYVNFHLEKRDSSLEEVQFSAGMMAPGRSRYCDLWFALAPQCKIGPYRVDALLFVAFGSAFAKGGTPLSELCMVIECDGHDFHERTKQQAAHDRMRDRWFTARGYKVMRFTGSEIFRDASKCAREVHAMVEAWADEQRRAAGYPEGALA